MEWNQISFEPNLKFMLGLNEDLKTKYLKQHEKAKETLERFSCSLENIYHDHQKLLADNIELSIINEQLKQVISSHETSGQQVSNQAVEAPLPSQIIAASRNCKLESVSKISVLDDNLIRANKNFAIAQKENIIEYVPIFSSDFNSDLEDDSFDRHKSPPASLLSTPVKVHSSPILSKRKRNSSKKSNSSISNTSSHSINSNNDSKTSTPKTGSFDKDKIQIREPEPEKEPLKTIENTFSSTLSSNQDTNKGYKLLGVSKTNYSNIDFTDKSKRLKQTTLSLKKVPPIIDISKVDSNETFYDKNDTKQKQNIIVTTFLDENISSKNNQTSNLKDMTTKNEFTKMKSKQINQPAVTNNMSAKDDDLIETSPAQSETSKLRNKLSFHKKSESSKVKIKTPILKNQLSATKQKSFEQQKVFNDDTYFSPAESGFNKIDEIDSTEMEEDVECISPPTKRVLLNSFDEIPGRKEKVLNYAYKERPVRNKNERAQLPGWECRDCINYYNCLSAEERKTRKNQCSKHRGRSKFDILTPESFWNPVFDDTINSSSCD